MSAMLSLLAYICVMAMAGSTVANTSQPTVYVDENDRLQLESQTDIVLNSISWSSLYQTVTDLNATFNQQQTTLQRQNEEIEALKKQIADLNSPGSMLRFDASAAVEHKLSANDAARQDKFGFALALSDSVLVVGAYSNADNGANSGSAYVFEPNATGAFVQISKLLASDGTLDDQFGYAVAGDRNMAVVGAFRHASSAGAVYVFEKNASGQYAQVEKLVASNSAAGDRFGQAVAADNGVIVVGAHRQDGNGAEAGMVYVYEKSSATKRYAETKLIAKDAEAGAYFGWSVAVDNDIIVVGASRDSANGSASGAAYVFERNNSGGFEQIAKLVASDAQANDQFAYSIAISNGVVVIGAYEEDTKGDNAGAAYVFERSVTGAYAQLAKLVASDGKADINFGWSVGVSNGVILVGTSVPAGPGSVYVFARTSTGSFNQTRQLSASDGANFDRYGASLAVYGDKAAIGAYNDGDKGPGTGAVYVYQS
eukprot:TRINITY_DN6787_c0_g2_i1.p1 TRINITY_DN6787_c0_g2~~TRINITY_DN6787_c0_g2_i1.p1  ORF type:complete len:483 (+),score=116.27 TRINITY_DN6787_c0_g2_i1:364-1812(+)